MVKKTYRRAFTLVEAMLSMIIIMIVTATIVPTLTKVKPRIEPQTNRGQYACWSEGGVLKEQYMDERTARRPAQVVSECKLSLDQRPARYYIIASGAGTNGTQGQVVTKYTSAVASDLQIELGTTANGGTTSVKSDDSGNDEVVAFGGVYNNYNQLIPRNIKSCKLLSAGDACPNFAGHFQESCEVVDLVETNASGVGSSSEKNIKIRINGCDNVDEYGYVSRDNILNPENLIRVASSPFYLPQNATIADISQISRKNSNKYSYNGIEMNFEFMDSSYYSNNENKSKMSDIVKTISIQRKSTLTDLIIGLNAGAPGKNGAVLILW